MRPTRGFHYLAFAEEIGFHVPFQATVDFENASIHDVAVITGAVEAEGRDLVVDATTVRQLHALARKRVPVNLDHGSGIKDTVRASAAAMCPAPRYIDGSFDAPAGEAAHWSVPHPSHGVLAGPPDGPLHGREQGCDPGADSLHARVRQYRADCL